MKVAVISDIHGNMQALETVLEDIEKEKCEKILCLGDLAMAGPEPDKTIDIVKKLFDEKKLELIQGNTDEMITNYEKFGPLVKEKFPVMGNALEADIKVISHEQKIFLGQLPPQKSLNIEGVNILMVHGSPRRNDENIMPNLTIKDIEEILDGVDADLILCGHTHIPCGYQTTKGQTVVNVGSVGRPFTPDPKACYVVLEFNNGTFEIKHKFLDYDRELASEILSKRKFPAADKLAKILLKPEERHI